MKRHLISHWTEKDDKSFFVQLVFKEENNCLYLIFKITGHCTVLFIMNEFTVFLNSLGRFVSVSM